MRPRRTPTAPALPRAAALAYAATALTYVPQQQQQDGLRLPSHMRIPSRILPRLYLSSKHAATSESELLRLGVTHIVSIIEQRPKYPPSLLHLRALHIPLADSPESDILAHLDKTTAFIRTALEDKRSVVLVHCAMGISRSATVVCAYLVAAHRMSADGAIAFAISRRPFVSPNDGFRRQLAVYATRFPRASVTRKTSVNVREWLAGVPRPVPGVTRTSVETGAAVG